MKIALLGYGKMGKEVEAVARERGITIASIFTTKNNLGGIGLTRESLKGVDVCIDFTSPVAAVSNIEAAADAGTNIVVGTTGWYDQLERVQKIVKSKKIGLLYAPNFSLGLNIFAHILATAARSIDRFSSYDVTIHETHHAGKVDSPSGTALLLGQIAIQNMRSKKDVLKDPLRRPIKSDQLQITSTRLGHVVGEHTITFDSDADTIELKHSAKNRRGFAVGALVAAEWIRGKRGVFTMKDILNGH
jgi:4-hydroxy-tetrahydrodipicolinate reductase